MMKMLLPCMVIAGLSAPVAQAAQAAAPPLELFARPPALEDVAVSPDGARVAWVERQGEARMVRVSGMDGRVLRSADAGRQRLGFIDWAGPDHLLLVVRQTVEAVETSIGGVPKQEGNVGVAMDVRTGGTAVLFKGMNNVASLLNSVPRRVRHQGRPALVATGLAADVEARSFLYAPYRLDPATGRGVALDKGSLKVGTWVARPNGELAAKSVRMSNGDWTLQIPKGSGWTELVRVPDSAPAPSLLGLGRDGVSLLVSGGPDGRDGLYEVSLDGVWSAPLPGAAAAWSTFFDRQNDGRLLAALGDAGPFDPIFYDPVLRTAWATARKSFPGKQLRLHGWSDDRRTLALGVADPGAPEAFYLLSLDAKRAEHLGDEHPQLKPEMLGSVREISFAAADGTALSGVLVTPPGAPGRNLPVVVLAKDANGADYRPEFDWMAQAFATRGYAVLSVDSRDFGVGRERAGDGQYGRKLVSDLADGVRHLAATGVVDPAKACIVGHGEGGYTALAAVTVQSGTYRCAVAINAPSDPRARLSTMREGLAAFNKFRLANYARLLGASGPGDASLREIDPRAHAGNGRAPVLLVHGEKDLHTPARESRAMHGALRKAGRPAELVILPEADNSLSQEAARLRVLAEAIRFLQTHNPG